MSLAKTLRFFAKRKRYLESAWLIAYMMIRVATLVEYTAPDLETPGELKMIEVAAACKISIITKMQKYATGSHFETSIWTLSNDKKVRLQQKCRLQSRKSFKSVLTILQCRTVLRSFLTLSGATT